MVAQQNKKGKSKSKKLSKWHTVDYLAEQARRERLEKAARKREWGPVFVEVIDDLQALTLKAGRMMADRRGGESARLIDVHDAGIEFLEQLIGFCWWCEVDTEGGLYPTLHPCQLTTEMVKAWFDLEGSADVQG